MILVLLQTALALDPWPSVEAARADADAHVAPTVDERRAWMELVGDLVRNAPTGTTAEGMAQRAQALDAEWVREDDLVMVTSRRGWGGVAVRLGEARPIVLVAPHPWFDLNTGRITARTFRETDARAAVFATTHRKVLDDAHAPKGGLQAASIAIAESQDQALFVQIHGFGKKHTGMDVVVGGWGADSLSRNLARALEVHTTTGVGVPALAGRHNVQVRALAGRATVAHLELSKSLRDALLADPERRALLYRAIVAWAEDAAE